MVNPYSKENPGNFANDRERASRAGKKGGKIGGPKGGRTTADRYLNEAKRKNAE
ncbi:MAG: general stress protein [Alphaproteobacteria bacterium]|nr:general stress protein [Alphaproteobacteria bacterium]